MRKYQIVLRHKGVIKSIFVRAGFTRDAVRKAYRKIGAICDNTRPNAYAELVDIKNYGDKSFSLNKKARI